MADSTALTSVAARNPLTPSLTKYRAASTQLVVMGTQPHAIDSGITRPQPEWEAG
ncbi:MAG: hypothetical protein ABSF95_12245 [Verrucomicrobiota bacterium]